MAKLEIRLQGDFNAWLNRIESGILNGSISASLEDKSDFESNGVKIAVRVFERYSFMGGNRVSLNITLIKVNENELYLSAITSGGSQAMFMKVNTMGEESFLDKLKEIIG